MSIVSPNGTSDHSPGTTASSPCPPDLLDEIADRAYAKLGAVDGRLAKAVALVRGDQVTLLPDGQAQVASQSRPGMVYTVNGSCPCEDAQHRADNGLCKHRLAVMLTRRVAQRTTSPAAPPVVACPEALFSVTLNGILHGRQALLTARGQTWEAFQAHLQRIEGLLEAPAAREAGSQAPPVTPWVCQYHGKSLPSKKAPGTLYCPAKRADGAHCKEQWPAK